MFRWQFTHFFLQNKLGEHPRSESLVWTCSASVWKIMDKGNS